MSGCRSHKCDKEYYVKYEIVDPNSHHPTGGIRIKTHDQCAFISNGIPGATGPTGATGPSAGFGFKFPGFDGATGATGPQGATGPTGATGPAGTNGLTGVMGPTGTNGPQGSVGVIGTSGGSGTIGNSGQDGPSGPTGPQGMTGPTGGNGNQGSTGASGNPLGATGPTGAVGVFTGHVSAYTSTSATPINFGGGTQQFLPFDTFSVSSPDWSLGNPGTQNAFLSYHGTGGTFLVVASYSYTYSGSTTESASMQIQVGGGGYGIGTLTQPITTNTMNGCQVNSIIFLAPTNNLYVVVSGTGATQSDFTIDTSLTTCYISIVQIG